MSTSENEIQAILAPYHDLLSQCYETAWQTWEQRLMGPLAASRPRVRANVINAMAVAHACLRFGDDPDVVILEENQTSLFVVRQKAVLRFKKLDAECRTRNYPTQRAMEFDGQMWLPHVEALVRLNVGYQLNAVGTALQDVRIVYQLGKQPIWSYSILAQRGAAVVNLPVATPPSIEKRRLVRPKVDASRVEQDGEE